VIDVPHLRERTCNDSTTATSVLTVDNFQSSDDGVYQCTAVSGNTTGEGGSIELRGISSNISELVISLVQLQTPYTCMLNIKQYTILHASILIPPREH
jgi:hypothetical protein